MASPTLGRLALGALAILAYQNRDKLGQMLKGPHNADDTDQSGGSLADSFGGLGELIERFRNAGSGSAVDSWISAGPNEKIEPDQVERALDSETLDSIEKQTGLSRSEILERLAINLPETVDEMTPEGRLPSSIGETTLLDPVPPRTSGKAD